MCAGQLRAELLAILRSGTYCSPVSWHALPCQSINALVHMAAWARRVLYSHLSKGLQKPPLLCTVSWLEEPAYSGCLPMPLLPPQGDIETMVALYTCGASLEHPRTHADGWSPLHVAAAVGQEAAARWLVERGASLETKDNVGWKEGRFEVWGWQSLLVVGTAVLRVLWRYSGGWLQGRAVMCCWWWWWWCGQLIDCLWDHVLAC